MSHRCKSHGSISHRSIQIGKGAIEVYGCSLWNNHEIGRLQRQLIWNKDKYCKTFSSKSHNLKSTAIESGNCSAVPLLAVPRPRRSSSSSCRNSNCCCHCCLPGHSPTGVSPIVRGDQQHWEAATWAHHLQGQHEHILKRTVKKKE